MYIYKRISVKANSSWLSGANRGILLLELHHAVMYRANREILLLELHYAVMYRVNRGILLLELHRTGNPGNHLEFETAPGNLVEFS